MNEIYHHGIKGQKWGVRRYQYSDGTLTPSGKKRYQTYNNASRVNRASYTMNSKMKEVVDSARTKVTGRQYVDGYLKKGTTFSSKATYDCF